MAIVPQFIGHRLLRETVWYLAEAILPPIIERLDNIMGTLVSVDSDVVAALTTLSQAVDTEIAAALEAGKLQPADVTGIQQALGDAKTQLDAAVAAGTATSTTDPTAPADPSTPVDPNAPAPADPNAPAV